MMMENRSKLGIVRISEDGGFEFTPSYCSGCLVDGDVFPIPKRCL